MAIILTDEKIHDAVGSYTTFQLQPQDPNSRNCIVVHELSLILVLGKVTAC